ncbi:hypothetical protein CFBP2533_27710 [Xanthomonas hortorum pv. pelargonii]|uniref:Uncharacterized protein n=1 Tax=Xanthomonas hortorum pv. pelargonii TaxID=453602 RepID=A0A6V7DUR4_9XANT|nr:hypothetical protein CFBP2533_27710 [Xanthomonas hortorum pv. pelargonii]CAD0341043.1 hypothetical protein CFBP2533_27710 [Xanthomonas hortorum pv. pelargonii]
MPWLQHAHRPSPLVLARPPSRDLTRHGCRVRAYMDVLAACPATVGGQGPCSQAADHHAALMPYKNVFAACPAMVGGQGPCSQATDHHAALMPYKNVLAACPAMVGGQGPCSQAADHHAALMPYKNVLAACPAMVGGQGPCSKPANQPLYNQPIHTVRSPPKASARLRLLKASGSNSTHRSTPCEHLPNRPPRQRSSSHFPRRHLAQTLQQKLHERAHARRLQLACRHHRADLRGGRWVIRHHCDQAAGAQLIGDMPVRM